MTFKLPVKPPVVLIEQIFTTEAFFCSDCFWEELNR